MLEPTDQQTTSVADRILDRAQWSCAFVSLALCLAIAVCYIVRWPAVVLVTVFPVWVWAAPGIALIALSYSKLARKRAVVIALLWATLIGGIAEEPKALITCWRHWSEERVDDSGFRIVSVNCAGGDPLVAEEALDYSPDILLLQETPGTNDLAPLLARVPEYTLVWGYDGAILAKGEVTPLPVPRSARSFMTLAQVTLRDTAMVVMSTRFVLPYCEPDLWRVGAWRSAREVHAVRVEQMDAVVARLAQEQDAPIRLGGDFNTPVGDSLYRKLRPKFHDAFREAGVGFGNTIINDIPLSRIDQIWLTDHFAATATVARKTEHSDHRMVITDLAAASPP